MCGRYALPIEPNELPEWFKRQDLNVNNIKNSDKRSLKKYNIGPTSIVPIYKINKDIEYIQWGIKSNKFHNNNNNRLIFNSRIENLHKLKIWRDNFNNRCIVPITGYYEWQQQQFNDNIKREKIPYFIKRKDNELIFLAGIYFKDDKNLNQDISFTIITRQAPKELSWLHERMPVILFNNGSSNNIKKEEGEEEEEGEYDDEIEKWLSQGKLPINYSPTFCLQLNWFKVNPKVGNTRIDASTLIEPYMPATIDVKDFFSNKRKNFENSENSENSENKNKKIKLEK